MDRSDPAPPKPRLTDQSEGKPRAPANRSDSSSLHQAPSTIHSRCRPNGRNGKARSPTVQTKPTSSHTDNPSSTNLIDTAPNQPTCADARRNRNRSRTANHHSHPGRRCRERIHLRSCNSYSDAPDRSSKDRPNKCSSSDTVHRRSWDIDSDNSYLRLLRLESAQPATSLPLRRSDMKR